MRAEGLLVLLSDRMMMCKVCCMQSHKHDGCLGYIGIVLFSDIQRPNKNQPI
jgi:hypothetical protein